VEDLSRLTIEELANLQVTSVSRRPEPLSQAPAAIYVITAEDIRRSGATSLAEILRLAPNLQVARLSSNSYAISARGFNHSTGTANKLQVQVDGRSVYTPLFSGVFWDEQDIPVGNIDRVEVISGPAGTLWGVNSVNGVINIITKSARDMGGLKVDLSGGSLDKTATASFGGTIGDNLAYRIYGMGADRGSLRTATGADAHDSWTKVEAGFRADWVQASDSATLEGDIYNGTTEDQPVQLRNNSIGGGDILGRWSHSFADASQLSLQLYYDDTRRNLVSGIRATVQSYDAETQYAFNGGSVQKIVVGGGFRATDDDFQPGPGTAFLVPAKRTLHRGMLFAQDEIALNPDLTLTLGLRASENSYTGWEYMPEARIGWRADDANFLWASVSRAVRSPSRFDRDLYATGQLAGGPDFVSENLIAYEAGYRGQIGQATTFSVSGFYNVYDHLRTVEASGPAILPLVVKNGMEGDTYGLEAWATHAIADWWRLSAGVSWLHKDLKLSSGSRDVFGVLFAGNDPGYQAQLRSQMNLTRTIELDLDLRAVDGLPSPRIPGYLEADARIAWIVTSGLEISLTGDNLLHDRHAEFKNPSLPLEEVPRTVTASLRWSY
jgi:iron complex outermembrane receptor protein